MSSKSTATPENALTTEEIDTRLGSTARAHLASFRADGMIHLTPIWFDWDGSVFRLSLGAGRVHLKNLAANPRVTILVDEDPRLQHGLAAGAWAIECRGTAELSNDETLIQEVTHRALAEGAGRGRCGAVHQAPDGRRADRRHDHAPDLAHLGLQQGGLTERRSTRPATRATRTVQVVRTEDDGRDLSCVSGVRRVSGRARTGPP